MKPYALIFAAGLGTRLKPLTDTMPKALVPVGGIPLLERVILRLKEAGYRHIVVNVHHFAEQIIDFIDQNDSFGISVEISDERDLLRETGGGIRHAAQLLSSDHFLVHNVDIISDLDIPLFEKKYLETERECIDGEKPLLATILVSERKTQRFFLFDNYNYLVGWTNIATGEVRSPFTDLNPDKYRKLAFAGIHNISEKIFPLMEEWPERFSIVDFYIANCDKFLIKGIEMPGLSIRDVGKIADLEQFNF
ncbi:MAG: NTP transferase domain-containing protein [Bacteroidales bacterium]|jgi:MurNAc alpha-1-phosphate uridylyltransferase|nr:NTP transferase domain-containing protein [Bacteroidales bacterium]